MQIVKYVLETEFSVGFVMYSATPLRHERFRFTDGGIPTTIEMLLCKCNWPGMKKRDACCDIYHAIEESSKEYCPVC